MNKRIVFVAVTVMLAILIVGGIGLAKDPGAPVYTGCLDKGQIKNVRIGDIPLKPCKDGETQISWGDNEITRAEFDALLLMVEDLKLRVEALEAGIVLYPTSYWYLDESGDIFADYGSYGIDATELRPGHTEVVPGVIGNGRYFYDPGSNIRLNSNDQYRWEADDKWSVEFWSRIDPAYGSADSSVIRIQEENFTGDRPNLPGEYFKEVQISPLPDGNFILGMAVNVIGGEKSSLIIQSISAPALDNMWHHWIINYDGSKSEAGVKMYRDGVLQTTEISEKHATWPSAFGWTDSVYQQIGGNEMKYTSLDEVIIYDDYVLTQEDVAYRYNRGVAHRGMGGG